MVNIVLFSNNEVNKRTNIGCFPKVFINKVKNDLNRHFAKYSVKSSLNDNNTLYKMINLNVY